MMHMRTTLNLDDELLRQAMDGTYDFLDRTYV